MEKLDYSQTIELLEKLSQKHEDVSVFYDNGWGDSKDCQKSYTIIVDGDGQKPFAEIDLETFKLLRTNEILAGNNLITYKARRNHTYKKCKFYLDCINRNDWCDYEDYLFRSRHLMERDRINKQRVETRRRNKEKKNLENSNGKS